MEMGVDSSGPNDAEASREVMEQSIPMKSKITGTITVNGFDKKSESCSRGFLYKTSTWFFNKSSNSSLRLISKASPSFTNISAGLKREL